MSSSLPAAVHPKLSIVIPIYNEEAILEAAVKDLIDRVQILGHGFEVILAENGSKDRTVAIARELSERFGPVRSFSLGEPNYGKALKRGIAEARGELVLCDEIDLCDTDFYRRALAILESDDADFVVGSKALSSSSDERPVLRHAATLVINGILRVTLGFQGTDTHGLKAFRRALVSPIAQACVVDKDLFASELVIRAERTGQVRMREIPVRVLEKRPPSIHLFRRVPSVLKGVAKLILAIRFRG